MLDVPITVDNATGVWYFDFRWFNYLDQEGGVVFKLTQYDKIIGD